MPNQCARLVISLLIAPRRLPRRLRWLRRLGHLTSLTPEPIGEPSQHLVIYQQSKTEVGTLAVSKTPVLHSHPVRRLQISALLVANNLASARLAFRVAGPLNAPVKHVIILVSLADKQVTEEFTQVGIIGLVVEAERTAVVEEDSKLVRETTAEKVGGSGHLLGHNAVILLLLRRGLETLLRESMQEVHEHVSKRLEIVAARLLCDRGQHM